MNNSLYLKRYVETHPDNKMAWYLLGKDYAANGEQGKANYCFNRAEEVYEAFELSKVPSDIWKNYELRLLQLESEKDKKSKRIRRILLAAVLILLILLPPSEIDPVGIPAGDFTINEISDPEESLFTDDRRNTHEERTGPLFTAVSAHDRKWSDALPQLLTASNSLPAWTVALGMERSGRFEIWSEKMPVLYGIHRNESGVIGIQPYKGVESACDCKPLDDSSLKLASERWAEVQVQHAVVSGAIQHFRERNNRLPTSLDELSQPFPNNWLSGQSPQMKRLFPILTDIEMPIKEPGKVDQQGSDQTKRAMPEGYGSSPDGQAFFKQPLEVIIDRKNHRLAVVSGSVLIRNYEVGLGRDNKTPLGQFKISDKVMNPNGSATGTYGSRGMQLSDSNYAIHGTKDIESIGGNVSEGCIRMHGRDVEELFDLVPMGTTVKIGEGVLPGELVAPKQRFTLNHTTEQSNPRKVYHWLD